jgi:hypothetical protein
LTTLDRNDEARHHEERGGDQCRSLPTTTPMQTPSLSDECVGFLLIAGRARRKRERHRRPSII